MIRGLLSRTQVDVNGQAMLRDQMVDDLITVAGGLAVVDDVWELTPRRRLCVEDMLVAELQEQKSIGYVEQRFRRPSAGVSKPWLNQV
jgi:hypothetical protein